VLSANQFRNNEYSFPSLKKSQNNKKNAPKLSLPDSQKFSQSGRIPAQKIKI